MFCYSSSAITFNNCSIKNNGGSGLHTNKSSPKIYNTSIVYNGSYGIYIGDNSQPTIGNLSTTGNDLFVNAIDEAPQPFDLITPVFDGDSVLFLWQNTADPDPNDSFIFVFEMAADSLFTQIQIESGGLAEPFFQIAVDEIPEPRGYWRVYAIDSDNLIRWAGSQGDTPWFVTGIASGNIAGLPEKYHLSQNYPNPFNPETRFSVSMPQSGMVDVTIYNLIGQHVRTLIHGNISAGQHELSWDSQDKFGRPALTW